MLLIPITVLAVSFVICLWAMLWTMHLKGKKIILLSLAATGLLFLAIYISYSPIGLFRWTASMGEPTGAGWQFWQIKYRVAGLSLFGAGTPSANLVQYGSSFDEYALIGFIYGLAAGLAVIALCGVALWRVYRILALLRDRTGRAVALGICTYVTMQVIWNVLMNFGVTPGLLYSNLPFFSQVWSQALILGTMFGILIGLYRRKDIEAPFPAASPPPKTSLTA